MFGARLFTTTLICALALKANAHAIINPALGVSGTPARSDVQRPSAQDGCGNINVANTIGSATPVQAAANGQFTVTVQDFNAGADGSRKVSGTVDTTATGKSFNGGAITVTQNGDAAPTTVGSDQVVASLPAGTKCTGGADKNICLVSFVTTAGFGNCVAVQQGSGAANSDASANNASTAAAANGASANDASAASTTTEASTANPSAAAAGKKKGAKKAKKGKKGTGAKTGATSAKAKGTRAARALREESRR